MGWGGGGGRRCCCKTGLTDALELFLVCTGRGMPWYFGLPEFLKKRACRYMLQHYLGQFLEERISLDDLTVDLYSGTGSIHNIPLNVQVLLRPYTTHTGQVWVIISPTPSCCV